MKIVSLTRSPEICEAVAGNECADGFRNRREMAGEGMPWHRAWHERRAADPRPKAFFARRMP